MKKVITIFILMITLLVGVIIFMTKFYNKASEVEVYTLSTDYSLLVNDDIKIKMYSNSKKSLLNYLDNATYAIHSLDNKKIITIDYKGFEGFSFECDEKTYYEYDLTCSLDIDSNYNIDDAYLKVTFDKGYYDLKIGRVDIKSYVPSLDCDYDLLYGLTDNKNYNSLAAVVINLKSDIDFEINKVNIGNYCCDMSKVKTVNKDNSYNIYDYMSSYKKNDYNEDKFSFNKNDSTIILPIYYDSSYYLYKTYLYIETSKGNIIVPNFEYVMELGFSKQKDLLITGSYHEYNS